MPRPARPHRRDRRAQRRHRRRSSGRIGSRSSTTGTSRCILGSHADNCPHDPGPDYDFGSGPNLFTIGSGQNARLVVGAGQKSGIYFALDAKTGQPIWLNAGGPGSSLGGIEWGPATDGKRIYVAEENFYGIPYSIPGGGTITSGSWAALDPATGNILWQVADPSHNALRRRQRARPGHRGERRPLRAVDEREVRALDASTGATLWSHQMPGASVAGAAVVNGVVYWGNGYSHLGIQGWNGNNKLYAFSINGK